MAPGSGIPLQWKGSCAWWVSARSQPGWISSFLFCNAWTIKGSFFIYCCHGGRPFKVQIPAGLGRRKGDRSRLGWEMIGKHQKWAEDKPALCPVTGQTRLGVLGFEWMPGSVLGQWMKRCWGGRHREHLALCFLCRGTAAHNVKLGPKWHLMKWALVLEVPCALTVREYKPRGEWRKGNLIKDGGLPPLLWMDSVTNVLQIPRAAHHCVALPYLQSALHGCLWYFPVSSVLRRRGSSVSAVELLFLFLQVPVCTISICCWKS